MIRMIALLLLIAATLAGCAPPPPVLKPGGTENLDALKRLSYHTQLLDHSKKISEMRMAALKDTAMSIGARSGLAYRANEINQRVKKRARNLDAIFNFSALILDHNVLPPVLAEGRSTLDLADNKTIRLADRSYRIVQQAKFVTTPPSWRSYINIGQYQKPEPPDHTLLPRNREEEKVWKTYVAMGWQRGLHQADNIYISDLARLKRDYRGMVLYRELLEQNIVSKPFVAKVNLGVTGNSEELNVNDQILRISALPALNKNSSEWKTIVAGHQNKAKQRSIKEDGQYG